MPLFGKKEKAKEKPEQASPGVEKPTEGICAKCGSSNLSFFDDGTGKCNNCGRIFNWRAALAQPVQAQPLEKEKTQEPQAQFVEAGQSPQAVPAPQTSAQPAPQPPVQSPPPSLPPPPPPPPPKEEIALPSVEPAPQNQKVETLPVESPVSQAQSLPSAEPMMQTAQPVFTPSVQTEAFRRSESIEMALVDLKNRLERVNEANERYRLEINEIKESIARIESRLHELTALYDAISAQFNPFIDLQIKKEAQNPEPTPEKIGEALSEEMILDKVACPKCGELIPEDAKVCPKCGASLEPSQPEVKIEQPVQSQIQPISQPVPQPPVFPQMPQQNRSTPILQSIGTDYRSSLLAMRWIEYLLDKVDLNDLPQVLDYYRKINWISNEVKADILWKIKGIKIERKQQKSENKDGWRLSINDHLKTLMFIEMLRGTSLDKQNLEELEREMEKLKKSNLEDFYGL